MMHGPINIILWYIFYCLDSFCTMPVVILWQVPYPLWWISGILNEWWWWWWCWWWCICLLCLLYVKLHYNYISLLKTAHHAKSEQGTLECMFLCLSQKDTGCHEGFIILQLPSPRTSYSPCVMKGKTLLFKWKYSNFDKGLNCIYLHGNNTWFDLVSVVWGRIEFWSLLGCASVVGRALWLLTITVPLS